MRNLLNFFIRNSHWWLFLLLVGVSFFFILQDSAYQRSIYLSSANKITGSVYQLSSSLISYTGLKTENEDLTRVMADMEARIQSLEEYIRNNMSVTSEAVLSDSLSVAQYSFIQAQVVNNSVSRSDNYITVNKGRADGIAPDMGVISATGAVGVVSMVSDHFSVIIPILNSKSRLSCMIRHSGHFGPLTWDGTNPRYAWLKNQPRHVLFQTGDTIVTSSFSSIFPPGIMVGTVAGSKKENNDNFNSLKVDLSTDFYTIKNVLVVKNSTQNEQLTLERSIGK